MSEHWTERLSEYLEGELTPPEREACELHLGRCAVCAGTLEELRAVVAQASLLPDLPPSRDLWPGIEARLASRPTVAVESPEEPRERSRQAGAAVLPMSRRRRVSLTVPQLLAAAVALVVLSGTAVRWMLPATDPAAAPATNVATTAPTGDAAAVTPALFTPAWDEAVQELEAEFQRRRLELDPETIRVVEENLAIIDAAISEANRALAEDPSSAFLSTHLASAMRQKVDLLRRVTAIERTES